MHRQLTSFTKPKYFLLQPYAIQFLHGRSFDSHVYPLLSTVKRRKVKTLLLHKEGTNARYTCVPHKTKYRTCETCQPPEMLQCGLREVFGGQNSTLHWPTALASNRGKNSSLLISKLIFDTRELNWLEEKSCATQIVLTKPLP